MRYQRHIDPDGDDSLARLLRRVPRGATVLELGPATGYCSRYLKEILDCTVDAIELSADMAELARPWCRELLVGDIERIDIDQALGKQCYDIILCADVLEHLRDPWSLARKLHRRLGIDGRLLVSVPNVGYLGLLVDLLRGNFRYRDEGLLDRTHLRFFTFDSLKELLEQSGWHVWAAEQVSLSLTDSEFRVRLESLAPALRDELLARPDALCYQWVIEARAAPPTAAVVLPAVPPEDRFQIRVFWKAGDEPFIETQNRLAWGALGREDQLAVLTIPAGQGALAMRISDRISFVRLRGMRLYSVSGTLLWAWSPATGPLPLARKEGMQAADADGLWFVSATDSRADLDLPGALVASVHRVELQLDSPMSADYLAARRFWDSAPRTPAQPAPSPEACEARGRQDALLEMAYAALGHDPSSWGQSARLIRLCRRVPGLVALVDHIAALRRRLRG